MKLLAVHEFAELAGVTVRALHHYDRLGLLKPSRRTAAGYRLYSEADLARLERIAVLKFLGLPLKDIRDLLRRDKSAIAETLRRQRAVLLQKRRQLDRAIRAIAAAERAPDAASLTRIIQEIAMQNETDWTSKYYSEEAEAKVDARRPAWSPELQEKITRRWNDLFRDIEASLSEDPARPKAQALAARWKKLVASFTGGDPEIQKGLNQMWSDGHNWPAEKQAYKIKPEIQEFIRKAMNAK